MTSEKVKQINMFNSVLLSKVAEYDSTVAGSTGDNQYSTQRNVLT